jgi:hypothetical protein
MIVRDNDILPHEARSTKHDKKSFVCEDVAASKPKSSPKDSAAAASRPSGVGFGVLRIDLDQHLLASGSADFEA